jgi:hypothetical protein
MLEAVDVLKGVFAFEEVPSTRIASITSDYQFSNLGPIHSRSQSQPLSSQKPASVAVLLARRSRAPSDPFLDTPSTHPDVGPALMDLQGATIDDRLNPIGSSPAKSLNGVSLNDEEEEDFLRTWTSPDIPNAEILELLKLFPPFITRTTLPRFPMPTPARITDLEEGDDGLEGRQIRFGTGAFWVSSKERSKGWQGGWWNRLVQWLKSAFC